MADYARIGSSSHLKDGEIRRIGDVFLFKYLIGHCEHEDTLNKRNYTPSTAGDDCDNDAENAGGSFAHVEILNTEVAEEECEDGCNAAAFAFGTGRLEGIVIVVVAVTLIVVGFYSFRV